VAVHAYGVPAVIEDPAQVKALLARLVGVYEGRGPGAWPFESLAPDYVDRMVRGIVAFEVPIERLEGKAKLGQNRSAADRAGAAAALRAAGDARSLAVAELMEKAGRPAASSPEGT
jgi:transcriptional regulator